MAITQRELMKRWLVGPWNGEHRRHGLMDFDRRAISVYSTRRRRGYERGAWAVVGYKHGFGYNPILSTSSPQREGGRDAHSALIEVALAEGMEKEISLLPINLLDFGLISLKDISIINTKKFSIRIPNRVWWNRHDTVPVYESVFSSYYLYGRGSVLTTSPKRYFISGYDVREPVRFGTHPLFVCELPRKVSSVDEGYQALKPKSVLKAERMGLKVLRQGDIFLIPMPGFSPENCMPRRSSHGCTCPECRRRELRVGSGRILGTDHEASRMFIHKELTYVTNWLSHRDHNAVRLNQRWYLAVRNTAPLRS